MSMNYMYKKSSTTTFNILFLHLIELGSVENINFVSK
jgi:hypothetical protein